LRQRQYVAYYRVSSTNQGNTGLSLEGQREAVRGFVREQGGRLMAEFSEIRSGLKSAGGQLREALRTCRMRRAVLTVASVDRISRRMALISALMDSEIELAVVDSPEASRVVLHIKAAWAEQESKFISERIKAALAEARKRGVRLGHVRPIEEMRAMSLIGRREHTAQAKARAMEVAPIAWKLRAEGKNLAEIAIALNWENVPTAFGRRWHSSTVWRVLKTTKTEFAPLAEIADAKPHHQIRHAKERAEAIAPLVWQIRLSGKSLPEVADELNRRGIPTTRGRKWCRSKVNNALVRGGAVLEPTPAMATATIYERRRARVSGWAWAAGPTIWRLRFKGLSLNKIADELERRKIATAKGGRWHASEVKTALELTRGQFDAAAA
jgi:DNA invertase Pin-like site-specific DNA recombinase